MSHMWTLCARSGVFAAAFIAAIATMKAAAKTPNKAQMVRMWLIVNLSFRGGRRSFTPPD